MSTFELLIAGSLVTIAASHLAIAGRLAALQRDIAEIWKRMPRID
ncbi:MULTISPECIES: hypothetical protein [Sphingomonas]|nr:MULTISPECIES: hypothetical protein [Sphingomonas]